MAENDKLAILLEWFKDNKVSWDNTKIDVRAVHDGFGVFALKDCPENDTRKSTIDLHVRCLIDLVILNSCQDSQDLYSISKVHRCIQHFRR